MGITTHFNRSALDSLCFDGSAEIHTSNNLLNSTASSHSRSSAGCSLLLRKQNGSSWITFYRSPSGEVVGVNQAKQGRTAYLPVKGLPSYLKIEQVSRAREVLKSSQIRLNYGVIEVIPRLKGGMLRSDQITESSEIKEVPKDCQKLTLILKSEGLDKQMLKGLKELQNLTALILKCEVFDSITVYKLLPLQQLVTVSVQCERLDSESLYELRFLRNLTTLALKCERFASSPLYGLKYIKNLTALTLKSERLDLEILSELGRLQPLATLSLQSNNIDKRGLWNLLELKNLTALKLNKDSFYFDEKATHISKMIEVFIGFGADINFKNNEQAC